MISRSLRWLPGALAVAFLAACHGSGGGEAAVDITAPTRPTGVAAAPTGPTTVNLSWNAATDAGGSGLKDYVVYRGGVAVATVTTTSHTDTGLTASTHYTYEVEARDNASNGSGRSAPVNVTTLASPDITPPSVPTGVTATATSATTANVSWSAATDPGGSGVKDYIVYRGGVAVATVTTTSFVDTGLSANTLYAYEISARDNTDNESHRSAVVTAATPATPDTIPPAVPAGVTATATGATTVNLSWGAVIDAGGSGVKDYDVYRNGSVVATVTTTSFADSGLTASTLYAYEIAARDNALNVSARSVARNVTTPAMSDTTAPSVPGMLTATAVSSTQVDLVWGAATDNVAVNHYSVERCVGASCASFTQIATPTGTTFSDAALAASTSYSYRVRALDVAGNAGPFTNTGSATTQDAADITPPSAPGPLTSSVVSFTQIDLVWVAATDDVGVTGYRVERCSGAGCSNFAQIATPAGTSFSDTGLTASTPYSYRVLAVDAALNAGGYSNTSSATTVAAPDVTPPSAPTNLTSSVVSDSQINLSWSAATDDVGVTGYRVERCEGAVCNTFAQIATPAGTIYNDVGLTASTSYRYRVRAVDAAGNAGSFSGTSTAATQAPPDTTQPGAPGTLTSSAVSDTQINLSWGAATDNVGVTGYRLERCSGVGCATFAQIATPTGTTYNDVGLTASTSYSYRVRAIDAAGNLGAFSNTGTAATQAPPDTTSPSAPGTLTSSAASGSQIDLSWGAATDNVGVTGYRVERCSGAGCSSFTQIATPTSTTFNDTGLTDSTPYSYRVRAVDAAGNPGPFSNTSNATTPDTTPPGAPGALTTSAVSATQIDLSWNAATDNVAVTGYRVERCSGPGCSSFTQIATPTGTTFGDTGLTDSTSYTYRVRAVDAAGNPGLFSNTSSATTPDTSSPSAPGALTSTVISSTQIDLSWNAATDDVGVTDYLVERCAGASCSNFAQIATTAGTSISDMGLAASTSYRYRVRAVDAAGNSGPFSNVSTATTPDTTSPSAPGTLTSNAVSDTQINLSWVAATDNVGVTGYRVERCSGAGCSSFTQIATPTGTTFNDTGLTGSTSYSYRVRAVDAAGNVGSFSNTSSATTADATLPGAPGPLTTSAVSATQIDLGWGAATDDVGVTGYRVERCSGAGCSSFTQIATPTGTTFNDTGLTGSTSYSYRVRAVDAAGNAGPFSNISSATTPDTTPPSAPGTLTSTVISSTQIDLSWNVATDNVGVTGYRVERCTGASCSNFAQVATPTGTSFSDTGLTGSTSYRYRVRAVDAANNLGAFSNISGATTPDATPPSAPGTLTSNAVSSTQIDLGWSAATDDVGVTGYRVERCIGVGCNSFAQIATPAGTSFSDTGLTVSTSYSYRVRAVDSAGNVGAFSNTTTATTPDTTPPSAPGALTSSAVSSTQIDLSWNAATDDVGVTGYRVERCTGAACSDFAQIAAPSGTSFSDTGLTGSTSYRYRVRAVDAANNSGAYSNTSSTTTEPAPDTTPPGAPGTLTSSAASSSQIDLSWGAATDDVGVTGYRVERCVGASCSNFSQIATPSGTTFSDAGLSPSTSYRYRVRAVDAAGNPGLFSNISSATTPDTTPPSAPGTLTSTVISSTQIDLSWNAATDDVGVTGYRVERCTGASCSNFAQIATPTGTSFSDTGLTGSTSYRYRVRAVDAAGNSGPFSSISNATTPDTTAPSAPGTLTSSAVSSTQIDLSWGAATDGVGVTGYRVERCSGVGCASFAQIATPAGTSFSDTGLTVATSYSYRVRAVDAAGNPGTFSNTTTATTPDTTPPSVPGTLTSSAVSSTQIDLSWGVATDDVGVTGYRLERCTGASCSNFAQIATPSGTSFSDTGLSASTAYRYRVRAVDAANNLGVFSNTSSATTPDTTPPSAPGTLTSSAVSSTQIDLSWSAATDDVGVTGYRVERCAGVGCSTFAQIATPTGTSFSDTGLTVATSYSYRVRAVDAADNLGAFSTTSSATTPDTTPPSVPGTLTSSAVSATQIDLSWGAATDDVGVTGYRVERCTGASCSNFAEIATPTGTSFSDTGLTGSTSYRYRVRAVDAANNLGAFSNTSNATTPDTTPPSAPGTLTSSAVSSTQIDLSWGAATDDVGVTGYRVERCTGVGCGNFAQIATPTGTSFSDTGLSASTAYSYRVRAVDAANNFGPFSNTSSATTQVAPDTTPPSAPGTLTSSAVSSTQIDLSWGAASDAVGVTGYRVERCSGVACANFAQIATPVGTSFSDTGLTASTSYSYRVRAVDAANNLGAFSNTSSATTQAAPDTTAPSAPGTLTSNAVSSTQINLSWGAATDDVGVTGYRVERCSGVACANFAQIATPAGTSFSDTGLTVATSYSYRVRAVDAANNLGVFSNTSSATTPDTTPPGAPGTLTSSVVSATQIDLGWSAATDDVGVTGYRVERCSGAGCVNFAQIATPAGTSFSDTGLTASTSYSYRVRAVDAAGNPGAFSSTSSATTQAGPDTTPPSAPGALTTSVISSTQIDLSWGAATDNVGVTGYRVERCAGASCSGFAQIATPAGTTFSDTGLAASTPYTYRVRAVDAAANPGAYSNTSSATTLAGITWGLDTRPSNTTCVAPARTVGSSTVTVTQVFNYGLSNATAAVQAPGDNDRWYMVERTGRIMTFTLSNPAPSVFLDITSAVKSEDQEAGMLGIAFHPDFANNHKLYVYYSGTPSNGSYAIQNRISEFTASSRTTLSSSTERVLLRADKYFWNHNAGQLAFGPDGFLYASLGDGGDGDDPRGNAQALGTLFGKIIRIDVNGTTGSTQYAIPPGNPYAGNPTCPLVASGDGGGVPTSRSVATCPEIYAYGFRNPWRFSLDRGSAAPDLWVGDVGENSYEEINRVQPGGNYGWDVREGPICHEPASGCATTGFTSPIFAAPRSTGMISIIGGFVYRGSAIPSLQGRYLFTDYFNSGLFTYDSASPSGYTTLLDNTDVGASAFAEDNNGELYLVDYFGGRLFSIAPGSGGGGTSPVPSLLSETGCGAPGNPAQPASGLVPYAPNAPFWSDAASKDRWMALPNGSVASVGADGDWALPPGTVLRKDFRLQDQLIETRLLMRHPDGEWAGYTYKWNASQTEATRVIGGSVVPVGTPSQNWIYPSETQCVQCHTAAAGRSLGLETGQLNHSLLYPQTGRTANQITTLAHVGILPASTPDASTLPVLPDPQGGATVAQRARAYLHTNCSFCHRPGGGAPGSMDLRYDTPMSATNTCNATPGSGNLGVAGAKLITPADPAASVLYLRMSRRGANQMPPVGSNLVDTDGAALLQQWISQMNVTCN